MSIGRAGGAYPGGADFDLARQAARGAEVQAPAATAAAAPVRGPAVPVPPEISRAVLAFDRNRHQRAVPDKSYAGIVDGRRGPDGAWIVRVGTFPTTAAGPRPGAKPCDIVAYTVRDGQIAPA